MLHYDAVLTGLRTTPGAAAIDTGLAGCSKLVRSQLTPMNRVHCMVTRYSSGVEIEIEGEKSMSLVGTLGKIAMGIAVAKGVGSMMNKGGSGGSGLGGLLGGGAGGLGSLLSGGQSGGGGLGNLGSLLGGGSATNQTGAAPGGLAGGLGGLLESMSGGAPATADSNVQAPIGGSLGDLLNASLQGKAVPEPEPAQEDLAKVLIKAMVNAAKSDGKIDQSEQEKIVANLGDEVTDDERQFVISEMQSPLDLEGFVPTIPKGAEMQVYMMSLLAIDLDSREEAQYLDSLRKAVGISEEQSNAIHQKMNAPTLYS